MQADNLSLEAVIFNFVLLICCSVKIFGATPSRSRKESSVSGTCESFREHAPKGQCNTKSGQERSRSRKEQPVEIAISHVEIEIFLKFYTAYVLNLIRFKG